ncbi:MAG: hypothetical protein ACRESZ_04865 [Methylococcales bacterium]
MFKTDLTDYPLPSAVRLIDSADPGSRTRLNAGISNTMGVFSSASTIPFSVGYSRPLAPVSCDSDRLLLTTTPV